MAYLPWVIGGKLQGKSCSKCNLKRKKRKTLSPKPPGRGGINKEGSGKVSNRRRWDAIVSCRGTEEGGKGIDQVKTSPAQENVAKTLPRRGKNGAQCKGKEREGERKLSQLEGIGLGARKGCEGRGGITFKKTLNMHWLLIN